MELGQKVYESAQQAQAQQGQPNSATGENTSNAANSGTGSSNEDGTVDADFEEVK